MKIRDKIKEIKYLRLKPAERFLLEKLDGIQNVTKNEYPESVFWQKNGVILFEQDFKNGWLRCNYGKIWSVLTNKYGYNYNDTQSIIKSIIDNYTKLGGLSPVWKWERKFMVVDDTNGRIY